MIWVEITYDDILENMPVDLRQVYDAFLAANPDKANRINEIVDNTVREFRDALKSAPNNIMDEREMWLPQSCVRHSSAIIFFELAMELGVNLTGAATSSKTSADVFLRSLPFGRWVATTEADYAQPSPRFIVPQRESYSGRALPALLSLIIAALITSTGCGSPDAGRQGFGSWVNPYAPGGAVNVGNVTVTNIFGDTYLTNIINNAVTVEGVVVTNRFEPSFSPTINNSNLISNGAFSGAVFSVNITETDPLFAAASNQFLKKSGGTMSGLLDMGNSSIYFKPIPPDPRYSSGLFFSNSISTVGLVALSNNLSLSRSFPFQSGGNIIWDSGNDGAGSGLNADLLDGLDSTQFVMRISGNDLVFTNAGASGTRVRISGDEQTLLISNSWSGAELIDLRMRGSAGQTGIYIDDSTGTPGTASPAQRYLDIRRHGVAEYIFTDAGIDMSSNKLSNVGSLWLSPNSYISANGTSNELWFHTLSPSSAVRIAP